MQVLVEEREGDFGSCAICQLSQNSNQLFLKICISKHVVCYTCIPQLKKQSFCPICTQQINLPFQQGKPQIQLTEKIKEKVNVEIIQKYVLNDQQGGKQQMLPGVRDKEDMYAVDNISFFILGLLIIQLPYLTCALIFSLRGSGDCLDGFVLLADSMFHIAELVLLCFNVVIIECCARRKKVLIIVQLTILGVAELLLICFQGMIVVGAWFRFCSGFHAFLVVCLLLYRISMPFFVIGFIFYIMDTKKQ